MKMKKTRTFLAVAYIMIIICPLILKSESIRTINPYSFLVGNGAIESSENIYSINPASISLLNSSIIYQNFSLDKNPEDILFSQNMVFKLSSWHSMLLGYSMMENNTISVKNSMARLGYALNISDFIYLGVNCNYRDEHYRKFYKNNLKTDLGLILSLKIDDLIKFINFGIYGLDANVGKINFKIPSKNYGKYSALGFALGLNLNRNFDLIVSADGDLVRDGIILSPDKKIFKYGTQLNFGASDPWLSVKITGDYYKDNFTAYSAGAGLNLGIFKISYGNSVNIVQKAENNFLSVSFKLSDSHNKKEVNLNRMNKKDIQVYYQKHGNKYRIYFIGDRSNIVFWHLCINDENNETRLDVESNDILPEYVIWDGKDNDGKQVEKGVYKIVLVAIKEGTPLRISKAEKQIVKIDE